MIITYFRSSSLNNYKFCKMQYFLNYVLGIPATTGQKAVKGSTVHKVLEFLALCKKHHQDNPNGPFVLLDDNPILDTIPYDPNEWKIERTLSDEEVDAINKTRINKYNYPDKKFCHLKRGTIRHGEEQVNALIDICFEYFKNKYNEHKWTRADYKDICNWTWMALEYMNGTFDPRARHIEESEIKFDITIDEDWGHYEYKVGKKNYEGQLSIKGTVDLVTRLDKDTLEIIDWKTGQRKDWSTGNVKTIDVIQNDLQLMMYYYALTQVFPGQDLIFTLFFIRDGGPFTVGFKPEHLDFFEGKLKKAFEVVKAEQKPKMIHSQQKDFKCQKICSFYKNNWPGTKVNQCKFIHSQIDKIGIDKVTEKYMHKDHKIDGYSAPGE